MPSLPDTAVIIVLGLLLFGPKGLAQIARQLGKLMGEFRRASNEFRMQMEEELRIAEQADRQKEIAAMQAAAPIAPPLTPPENATPALASAAPDAFGESHPHIPSIALESVPDPIPAPAAPADTLPIATAGDLHLMPPATGLPEPRSSSLSSLIDSVPKIDAPGSATNGSPHPGEEPRPPRYANHHADADIPHTVAEESLRG
jgi:sec-independent protein translocase protein TatB